MMLLLDTHVFLWYITADSKLPTPFRVAIQDAANEVFLSAVSVWEAVIKHGMGKLPLGFRRNATLFLQRRHGQHDEADSEMLRNQTRLIQDSRD